MRSLKCPANDQELPIGNSSFIQKVPIQEIFSITQAQATFTLFSLLNNPELQAYLKALHAVNQDYSKAFHTVDKIKTFFGRVKEKISNGIEKIKNIYRRILPTARNITYEAQATCLPIQMAAMLFTKGLVPIERGDHELIVKQQTHVFLTILIPIIALLMGVLLTKLSPEINKRTLIKYGLWLIMATTGIVASYLAHNHLAIANLEKLESRGLIGIDLYQQKLAKTVMGALTGYLILRSVPDKVRKNFLVQQALQITQATIIVLKFSGKL